MPKRGHFSPDRGKNSAMKKLKRQLREMQEQINRMQSSESSANESSKDSSDSESQGQVFKNFDAAQAPVIETQTPLDSNLTIIEGNSDQPSDSLPKQNITVLGEKPDCCETEGKPIHEEILVRWNSYLTKGIPKDQRKELFTNYKIPSNCRSLVPPQINGEIHTCLPKPAQEHDGYMMALQQQLAHGLSAVGVVMEKMLPIPEQSENLKMLADACQLFSNVHYAISAHRKYKIMPHLNTDCQKVAKTLDMDEFLFNKKFAEAVKNEQTIKKASADFKKKTWQPSLTLPGPSGIQSTYHLNYQRHQYKGRMKDKKKEERPSDRYSDRYRRQKRETKKYYYRK